jgi:DNA repair protein RadA/Sms
MSKKTKTQLVCSHCGEEYISWQGKCDSCGNWNTLKEVVITKTREGGYAGEQTVAQALHQVQSGSALRTPSGFQEVDRVLGGGIVKGSVILLGGDPGIGKSTLLLQVVSTVQDRGGGVLYVSGEESLQQIHARATRLGNLACRY